MQVEEMLVYVREVNRKCQKRMESRENLVLDIEENIARNSRQRILVVLDQIKSLGRFKDVWPASEKSNPFEKRCAMAKARQHFHGGNIEMFYMFQGSGKNYIGDQEYEIHQGDLWLLGKSVYHGIALNDDAIIMNVLFEPEITSDLYEDPACQEIQLFRFLMENALEREMRGHMAFSVSEEEGYGLLHRILKQHMEARPYFHKNIQHILMLLFLHLARVEKERTETDVKAVFDIYAIYSYISSHCMSATLESTAAQFNYSPSALSKMIKNETGESFSVLVRKMKLKKAKKMLANTDRRIEDIATDLNYSNRFTFERAFAAEFQMTPKEYRESLYGSERWGKQKM